jgi:hypothetical protein
LENDWKTGRSIIGNPNLPEVWLIQINQTLFIRMEVYMPKKNLLISAALTAFVLVILTGVVSAYKQFTVGKVAEIPSPVVEEVVMAVPTEVVEPAPVVLTHQEAAMVAANYLGQTDIYSVENTIWNVQDAFKVVFSSGDIVYVSMDGQILGTEAPETVVITNSGSNNSSPRNTASHDDHDDHDDHDEHDDDHDD